MRQICFSLFFLVAQHVVGNKNFDSKSGSKNISAENNQTQLEQSMRGGGMNFIQNKGQIADIQDHLRSEILFKGDGGGANVYIRKTGVSYVLNNLGEIFSRIKEEEEENESSDNLKINEPKSDLMKDQIIKVHRLDVDFVNCNPSPQVFASEQVDGYTNYYYPHCPDGITHVNSYNEITVKNIYNNIDIKYYGGKEVSTSLNTRHGLKYDIIVNKGGDPGQVKLKYSGTDGLEIRNGELIIKNSVREIIEQLPKVYQNINGEIIDVKTEYKLEQSLSGKDVIIHFSFLSYNPLYPMVIDPWASYYGGSDLELQGNVTNDPSGNVLFTGVTRSVNFPVSPGAFQIAFAGGTDDAFVVKMNPAGNRLWATYYGGNASQDNGMDIASDAAGNILMSGNVSGAANIPIGASAGNTVHQNVSGGGNDAFLLKLDPTGARLWATYYGGAGAEGGQSVATDGINVYLCGQTSSTNGISTGASFQPVLNGTLNGNDQDVYLVKFTPTGARIWGTYTGGSGQESPGGVACDKSNGNIYLTGHTTSNNFPVFAGYQMIFAGTSDAFLVKFNAAGVRIWATYYGGPSYDNNFFGIAVDGTGNVIIAGKTQSSTGISSPGAYQTVWGGTGGLADLCLVKFTALGIRLWATYMGGNLDEWMGGLAVDGDNNIYLYGEFEDSNQGNYPISSCAYKTFWGGIEDQFIAKYDPNGIQKCITFYGGTGEDDIEWNGKGISVSGNFIYITGYTFVDPTYSYTGNYPVTPGAFQTAKGGGTSDIFIAQLCINICETKTYGLNYSANTTTVCINSPVTFSPFVTASCDTTGYRFKWTFTGSNPATSTAVKPIITYPTPGVYPVKLVLTTACKKDSVTKASYITVNSCGCTMSASASVIANVNCAGGNNGSAQVTISSGSVPYMYNWSNGTSGSTTTTNIQVTGLSSGSYTVTITDGLCASVTSVTITQALVINSVSSTNVTCNGGNNGGATITVNNSTGSPYTYNWSNGVAGTTIVSPSSVTGLSAGVYSVTISAGSCTSITTVIITQPLPLSIGFATQWSCTANNTIVSAYSSGGTAPYNYLWSNTQTTSSLNLPGISPGTISVTITDGLGCSATANINASKQPLDVSITSTNSTCTANGSISATINSGIPPYTYSWNSGQTTPGFTPAPGNYTLTVTDGSGCTTTKTAVITSTSPVSATFTKPVTACIGSPVSLINTGTTGTGVTYSWSIGAPVSVSGTTVNFTYTFLTAGTYSILHQVFSGGCLATVTSNIAVINCSAAPTVTATGSSVCPGSCGTISSNAIGGSAPYTYLWSNGATTQNISPCPISTTTYTVTIRDAGGNTSTSTAVVTINPAVTVTTTATNITCSGASTGSATATGAGGSPGYTFAWSNGGTTSQISNL
ncbi:MAG: SBBP repeat-containing protein, partial [Bacteroidetes bacterium]|nr:SBBP repeat-containing protein [Bacteroidota bacterium]